MLVHNPYFNIMHIADSGQCFRMNRIEDKDQKLRYSLIAYGRYLELTQVEEDTVDLTCTGEEYEQIWKEYFDLNYDYSRVVHSLSMGEDEFLQKAVAYGRGIRILKQEPFEATISFIISQNKNIPAIKTCIEAISRQYGEEKTNDNGEKYWTFPSPTELAGAKQEDLRALKTGYRDTYIIRTAQAIVDGELQFDLLKNCSYEEAVKKLRGMYGIGEKVANCIALYGLHHIEGFPIDVWIRRVLEEVYQNNFKIEQYEGYAGIVQQYMFYYMRHLKHVS